MLFIMLFALLAYDGLVSAMQGLDLQNLARDQKEPRGILHTSHSQ